MSPARSQPPDLPGYTYQRWLGGGGFADVFLYLQQRPAREVAVKVLRSAATDELQRSRFDAEADLMARVSTHPYITSIFAADIGSDGRPFLVMEYYPNGHYGTLARGGGMAVADVLRTGVQVASAVETAHRAGILHRDIKPANILVSTYHWPGLTDFGIAGARGDDVEDSAGLSLPYSPPEVIAGDSSTVQSDVYSLAATIYLLLAGRTPFEVPGHNTDKELAGRILNAAPPHSGRTDAPASLEHLLSQALARDPQSRPPSAAAFAQALQDIERELQLSSTPFEVRIDDPVAPERRPDDEERTRAAAIQVARTAAPFSGPDQRRGNAATPLPSEHGQPRSGPSSPAEQPGPRYSAVESRAGSDGHDALPVEGATRTRLRPLTPSAPTASDPVSLGTGGHPGPGSARSSTGVVGPPRPAGSLEAGPEPPLTRGSADTIRRGPAVPASPAATPEVPPPARHRALVLVLAGAAGVAALIVVVVVALSGSGGHQPKGPASVDTTRSGPTTSVPPLVADPDPPSGVRVAVSDGTAQVTWAATGAQPGDRYRVVRVDPGHLSGSYVQVRGRSATIHGIAAGGAPCFEVLTVRSDQVSEPSSPACAAS